LLKIGICCLEFGEHFLSGRHTYISYLCMYGVAIIISQLPSFVGNLAYPESSCLYLSCSSSNVLDNEAFEFVFI